MPHDVFTRYEPLCGLWFILHQGSGQDVVAGDGYATEYQAQQSAASMGWVIVPDPANNRDFLASAEARRWRAIARKDACRRGPDSGPLRGEGWSDTAWLIYQRAYIDEKDKHGYTVRNPDGTETKYDQYGLDERGYNEGFERYGGNFFDQNGPFGDVPIVFGSGDPRALAVAGKRRRNLYGRIAALVAAVACLMGPVYAAIILEWDAMGAIQIAVALTLSTATTIVMLVVGRKGERDES